MTGVQDRYMLLTALVQLAAAVVLLNSLLRRRADTAAANRRIAAVAATAFVVSGVGPAGYVVARAPQLLGTAYGLLTAAKLAAACLPAVAWLRWRLPASGAGRDRLRIGMMVVAVAFSLLLTVAAPVTSGQPLWPFAWTLSLEAVRTDPIVRIEVIQSLPWIAAAGLLCFLTIYFWRRLQHWRWLPAMLAAWLIWQQAPIAASLIVSAYPTFYYHSPNRFAASSIVHGEMIYLRHCAGCHGATAQGGGSLISLSAQRPADLTAGHLWMHSDGELFWSLSHGIDRSGETRVMPGFIASLSSQQIWDVIDYVRIRNAGSTRDRTGRWSPTVLAPEAEITCVGREGTQLADLRGRPVRIVLGGSPVAQLGIVTVFVTGTPNTKPVAGGCVAGVDVAHAYALAGGLPVRDTDGTQFLIDEAGWLRAMQKPSVKEGWNNPQQLAAAVWQLNAAPVTGDTSLCHASD